MTEKIPRWHGKSFFKAEICLLQPENRIFGVFPHFFIVEKIFFHVAKNFFCPTKKFYFHAK
jgi:hypothetical protein